MNILIHGVAKTGTTALFYSVRKALAGTVTELFEPGQAQMDAALATPSGHVLAKVLLRETIHVPYERFPRKIMIVRDPRDTLVSRVLYLVWHAGFRQDPGCMDACLTLLRIKERDPRSISLKSLYSAFSGFQRQHSWREYLRVMDALVRQRELLAARPDFFVQRYEEFIAGRVEELSAWLGGLNLDCRVKVPRDVARVERSKGYGDWRHWFTPDDVSFFRPMLAPALEALGYEDDWRLADVPAIDSRFCSEYAARLHAERCAQIAIHWPPAPATHAEVLPVKPEMLETIMRAAALKVSVAPLSPEQGEFVAQWDGGPITGDVCLEFHLDADVPDPLTRLHIGFGEGFSDPMSLVLALSRGDNLIVIRFHQPAASLAIGSANASGRYHVRDVRLRRMQ